MPTVHVTTVLDPAALLERAVEGLLPLAPADAARPWPTLAAWLVLRQGGLRDDLVRLAAQRGVPGWFGAPVCLFNELRDRWGDEAGPPPLGDAEREALLSAILAEHGRPLFGTGDAEAWVPPVDRFIGELVSEGIDADALARALEATAADRLGTLRAEVLTRAYRAWLDALAALGRTDGRDTKVLLARAIAADPDGFARKLDGRREVRIVGLADLRGGWRPLLAALAATPVLDRVEVLASSPLPLDGIPAERRTVPDPGLAAALFTERVPGPGADIRLVEAPDVAREVEHVAVRVRALIDGGAEPGSIAVIARQARPTVDLVAAALGRVGVPVTARRRTALGHTTPGRAIAAILRAAAEGWSRHSVAELAEHPLLRTGLDARVVNHVGYASALGTLEGWSTALAQLRARCEARARGEESDEERRSALPPLDRVQATIAAWTRLLPRLDALQARRPLGEWCGWVATTLEDGEWGIGARLAEPCADEAVWRADLRARDAIAELARTWQRAAQEFGHAGASLDAAAFGERLALMLAQDLVTPPETDFAVVVAEALAAGWRSFRHVFVVGLTSGEFPRRPAPGPLFDAPERRALAAAGLALDPVDAWRERERELFRVLCAGARETLTLSWPAMDAAGHEVARSAYVDEVVAALVRRGAPSPDDEAEHELVRVGVLTRLPTHEQLVPGFPVLRDARTREAAAEAAARERARSRDPSPWNGRLEEAGVVAALAARYDERYQWSATQLEEAAKCRWQWFATRQLRLEERADADDLMEPTTRGSILHGALDRFFTAARARFGDPAHLRDAHLPEARVLLAEALHATWEAIERQGAWLGPVPTRAAARAELLVELEAYLAFEVEWNEKSYRASTTARGNVRTGAAEGEFAFDDVALEGDGVRFRLRGRVDRVDRGVDERVDDAARYVAAIDYKSTVYSTPGAGNKAAWDDGIVLQVPLYAAALRATRPLDAIARLEYRSIRGPKAVHQLVLAPMKRDALQDAPEAEAKLAGALAAAGRIIAAVRRGELPAAPAPSAGCSPYCPARDVCRIPGGPVEAGR